MSLHMNIHIYMCQTLMNNKRLLLYNDTCVYGCISAINSNENKWETTIFAEIEIHSVFLLLLYEEIYLHLGA